MSLKHLKYSHYEFEIGFYIVVDYPIFNVEISIYIFKHRLFVKGVKICIYVYLPKSEMVKFRENNFRCSSPL